MRTITWLHISDLHTNNPRYGWDYDQVTDNLVLDLKTMERDHGLLPDFIFFTGDAAFGRKESESEAILVEQYNRAAQFLQTVRTAFSHEIPIGSAFLVPGNHDIDSLRHNEALTAWLNSTPAIQAIYDLIHKGTGIWPQFMEKLATYGQFLTINGYGHLIETGPDGIRVPDRGIYCVTRECHGIKVAVAGLNSAWSSAGKGSVEKAKLRLGGRRQLGFLREELKNAHVMIALMHHPINWFHADEDPSFEGELQAKFHFFLHGHEHANRVLTTEQYVRIGAGACYENDDKETGYNFVRLCLDEGHGEVWLRRYNPDDGGGWIPYTTTSSFINNDGLRELKLDWMSSLPLPAVQTTHIAEATVELPAATVKGYASSKETFADREGLIQSSAPMTLGSSSSETPLELIAIPPDLLADYLCDLGPQLVIGNEYVRPKFRSVGGERGALSRIYVGPADCGKTRAALEWILEKVMGSTNAWTVLRAETGAIPRDASKFTIDEDSYYRRPRHLPKKAILFVDDLPDYLGPADSGAGASEAAKRLFDWFRQYPGFEERCLVGTIRTERMGDKRDWPDRLPQLGQRLELLSVEPLDKEQRRALWKGMRQGKISRGGHVESYEIGIEDDFLDLLTDEAAPPESIAYFVRSAVDRDADKLTAGDAEGFSHDVAGIWLKRTWPAITEAYGMSARVFHTLARFLEAGTRRDSNFLGDLPSAWEYHDVLGSALLGYRGGNSEEYLKMVKQMLKDGNAAGRADEWVRPKWDFLLQAPSLEGVDLPLPPWEWFGNVAASESLSPDGRGALAMHLAAAGIDISVIKSDAHWLMGWAQGKWLHSMSDKGASRADYEEAIAAYEDLVSRFGDSEEGALKEQVAKALVNKGVTLGQLKRPEEEIAAYEDLVSRFGDSEEGGLKEQVAKALVNKGVTLGQLERPEEEIAAYEDLVSRFGDSEEGALKEQVAKALFNKAVRLGHLERPEEEIAAYEDLVSRFGDSEEQALKEPVAKALVNKSFRLGQLERPGEAIAAYEDLVSRFGDSEEEALKEQVAMALVNKGFRLGQLERPEEAIAAYEDLVSRFGDSEEGALKEQVAMALTDQSSALVRQWRRVGDEAFLDTALERARSGASMGAKRYNIACVLALLGKVDDAFDELEGCLTRNEDVWSDIEDDPDWDALHTHPRYKALKAKYGNGGKAKRME
jgi:tetratricopeptide (TPR) repeat protein